MNKCVKRWALAMLLVYLMSSVGCALLPEEDVLPDAPVVRGDSGQEFTLAYVQRGDLIRTQRYGVTYRAVRQEQLCFEVDGLRVDEVLVQQGDSVKKGQVLMRLEQDDWEESLRSAQAASAEVQLALEQAQEQRERARDEYALALSYMDEEELEDAQNMEEYLRANDREIQRLENQLELAQKEERLAREELEKRSLRAGIDGAATYVRAMQPDALSERTQIMVILADSTSSMFVVETSAPENFYPGREVEVTVKQTVYPCYVISAQEAGASGEGEVYLRCSQPTAELSDGDSGVLMLEIERCEDVLYLEKSAIKTMDGRQFVYIQDENGLRSTVEVTTGRTINSCVEILSGLAEGDAVILR